MKSYPTVTLISGPGVSRQQGGNVTKKNWTPKSGPGRNERRNLSRSEGKGLFMLDLNLKLLTLATVHPRPL